jgi:[ribosomal protein S18]-alanine N-acetyltransferase
MTMDIRTATPDDAGEVCALERSALGRDAWSESLVRDGVAGLVPTALYLVAFVADELAAYAATSIAGDVAELQRIAVHETHRRTGVASALLTRVEEEAAARHADRLLLEVREDNATACAFYAASGFREIDRRHRYYADGTTAVVLEKTLA